MKTMTWLDKKVQAVLKAWKNNTISFGEAHAELCRLGYSIEAANAFLLTKT